VGKFFKRFAGQGGQDEHGNLIGGPGFMGGEEIIQTRMIGGGKYLCTVYDPTGEGRNVQAPYCRSKKQNPEQHKPSKWVRTFYLPPPHPLHGLNPLEPIKI
jgi:hypothetical protein